MTFNNFTESLMDAALEKKRDQFDSTLETFENHKENQKIEIRKMAEEYVNSLEKGYNAILEEIDKKLEKRGNL